MGSEKQNKKNNNTLKDKENRCEFCNKKLFDEKIPVCPRCRLKGKKGLETSAKAAGAVAGGALLAAETKKLLPELIKNIKV